MIRLVVLDAKTRTFRIDADEPITVITGETKEGTPLYILSGFVDVGAIDDAKENAVIAYNSAERTRFPTDTFLEYDGGLKCRTEPPTPKIPYNPPLVPAQPKPKTPQSDTPSEPLVNEEAPADLAAVVADAPSPESVVPPRRIKTEVEAVAPVEIVPVPAQELVVEDEPAPPPPLAKPILQAPPPTPKVVPPAVPRVASPKPVAPPVRERPPAVSPPPPHRRRTPPNNPK